MSTHDSQRPDAPPAQGWAWAAPVAMEYRETEPLEYHRLYRGVQGFRWWKSLIVLLLAGAFYILMTLVLGLVFGVLLSFTDPEYLLGLADGSVDVLDTQRPMSVLLALVSIALMIPCVVLAMLVMGVRPTGRVWSVAGKIRWGFLMRTAGIAVLAVVVMNLTGVVLEIVLNPSSLSESVEIAAAPGFDSRAALLSLVFIITLVPLQAAAEEVAFRGLLMQVIGSWLRSTWFWILLAVAVPALVGGIYVTSGIDGLIEYGLNTLIVATVIFAIAAVLRWKTGSPFIAVALPTLLFAVMHIYDVWGMLVVSLMGLVAAWLTWRTGGLEAAVAIHVVNNLVAFGFMTAGFGGETAQTESAAGPGSLVGEVVGLSLFTWLVLRSFRKGGYGRTRIDLMQVPVPPQPAPVATPLVSEPAVETAPQPTTDVPPAQAPSEHREGPQS